MKEKRAGIFPPSFMEMRGVVNQGGLRHEKHGRSRVIWLALWCSLVSMAAACGTGPQGMQSAPAGGGGEGTIAGSVLFSGVPCPPDRLKVPPCDGPYPDYEVIVYERDGKTVAARTRTDREGSYRVVVPSGSYVIYSRGTDLPAKTVHIPNAIAVEAGKTAQFDIRIETGIQ